MDGHVAAESHRGAREDRAEAPPGSSKRRMKSRDGQPAGYGVNRKKTIIPEDDSFAALFPVRPRTQWLPDATTAHATTASIPAANASATAVRGRTDGGGGRRTEIWGAARHQAVCARLPVHVGRRGHHQFDQLLLAEGLLLVSLPVDFHSVRKIQLILIPDFTPHSTRLPRTPAQRYWTHWRIR